MKTIEERVKEVGMLSQVRSDYPYDKRSVEFGYTQGYQDAVEKACKWLKSRRMLTVSMFKKAMEE